MKFDNPTLVTLTAPTCSGKSYLLNHVVDELKLFDRIVSTTTRTMRLGEREGVDYYFIDRAKSEALEASGAFFELIEFNNTRYGVTHEEMDGKMGAERAPMIILEPQGLAIYEKECRKRGWDIFKIYVHTPEKMRLERLKHRLVTDVWGCIDAARSSHVRDKSTTDTLKAGAAKAISEYERRFISITGPERGWQNTTSWDAIIPGYDVEEAVACIERGIKWRNRQVAEPIAYTSVDLPL